MVLGFLELAVRFQAVRVKQMSALLRDDVSRFEIQWLKADATFALVDGFDVDFKIGLPLEKAHQRGGREKND